MRALSQALPSIAVAVGALLYAREASAAGQSTQWYVETVGPGCGDQRAALEREITLACGAVKSACSVATSPNGAELRAVLDCTGSDSWSLVTRTKGGIVLNTIDLTGPRADRLREAAVEVARDLAPEHALAVETLRFSLTAETAEQPARVKTDDETLTLVFGARATADSGDDRNAGSAGGHVMAGVAIVRSLRATLGGVLEGGGRSALRGGLGVALGAPFDGTSIFGVAAEAGLASTERFAPSYDAANGGLPSRSKVGAGYGQGTLTVQLPLGSVRPYAALSAAVLTESSVIFASAEAGVAFAIF